MHTTLHHSFDTGENVHHANTFATSGRDWIVLESNQSPAPGVYHNAVQLLDGTRNVAFSMLEDGPVLVVDGRYRSDKLARLAHALWMKLGDIAPHPEDRHKQWRKVVKAQILPRV